MCSGPGPAGAQQHRPGRTAPSLLPAFSQRSGSPAAGRNCRRGYFWAAASAVGHVPPAGSSRRRVESSLAAGLRLRPGPVGVRLRWPPNPGLAGGPSPPAIRSEPARTPPALGDLNPRPVAS
ncbi:hypothetical protein NN561_012479 [Cricetulus griseus]